MKTPQAQLVIRSIAVLVALVLSGDSAWSGPLQITQAQLAAMQPMDPGALPSFGNYYLLIGPYPDQPWPPLPCPPNDLPEGTPIYDLGEGQFLIDDTGVSWEEIRAQEAMEPALRSLEVQYGLASPMTMENSGGTPQSMDLTSYPDGSIWLFIGQSTNGDVPLTINGTIPDGLYEIQSEAGPADSAWASEGVVLGAGNQNWTLTTVAVGDRTNRLFFRVVYWPDCDGLGTPAAWYIAHGLYPLSAGIATQDADQDGLLNRQEYLYGSDPQGAAGFSVWLSSPGG
ncbi:MAG: hypothetical protein NT167_23060 [Verrucomicrobia bacterium]|nr:hypothetical protein [Verrucomicrobiota bacterium]